MIRSLGCRRVVRAVSEAMVVVFEVVDVGDIGGSRTGAVFRITRPSDRRDRPHADLAFEDPLGPDHQA